MKTLVIAGLMFLTGFAVADKYEPTADQKTRLELQQARAQLAFDAVEKTKEYAQYLQAINNLDLEAQKIIKEQKWPDTLIFHRDKLVFTAPEPAPAPTVTPVK
jgi:hypothetical protein